MVANLVKESGRESSQIDDENDMAFSQEVLHEIVDLFCINPESGHGCFTKAHMLSTQWKG